MAVSIRIELETGIAIGTCSGVLRLSDAQESVAALWRDPGWSGKAAVWDFREAELDMSPQDVRSIAHFVLQNQPATPPLKVAFVAGRDVDFGLSRMFEIYREDPRTEFRVFRDCEEALCWARAVETGAA
jgi:hypothetical protein